MNHNHRLLSIACTLLILTACAKPTENSKNTILNNLKVTEEGTRASIAPDSPIAKEITATLTLNKKEIFDRVFFYSADLQYSSIYDKDYDLYTQSEAFGHIPASFRKNGDELQLVADQRRLYPSDVNHPEQLVSRFKIISETEETITVSEGDASAFLVSIIDSKEHTARDHWARSFEFIQKGNYLLQETSVVLQDGTVAEMMESIFPSETLAVSKIFEKFEMDPEDAVGGEDGVVARYRLLNGEAIFNGEDKLAFAQHYDINDAVTGAPITIDWYVTPNIKDEHLPVVKEAVEGWNRYFRNFKGINRDVVLFKGKVPAGVKLGDPRYNIINWDSRLVAGAAYESQATDPFTGKQSHSLIYMPVAWFQIGMDYWTAGKYSEGKTADTLRQNKNSKFKLSCARDLSGAAATLGSARMTQQEASEFSVQLMKQTLFHEVGHALGLAHNFKGSLTYDRQDPKSLFSSSIMDYNDYEIERAAFTTTTSAEGPELEYDRQALSAIYNKMADVSKSDAVMPACNDAEADTEESGAVDPLCIRYDLEKDPTLSVSTALNRVNLEKIKDDVSLVDALDNVTTSVLSNDAISKVKSSADALALSKKYNDALNGVMNFYFVAGKASVSRAVRTNIKSLYVFEKDVLAAGYDEEAMRDRAFTGVMVVAKSLNELPEVVKNKLIQLSETSRAMILKSGFGSTIPKDASYKMGVAFESDANRGLLKLRIAVYTALARVETLPLYFGSAKDYEAGVVSVLTEVVCSKAALNAERIAAAKSLASYRGRPVVDASLEKANAAAKEALAVASDTETREFALKLNEALDG